MAHRRKRGWKKIWMSGWMVAVAVGLVGVGLANAQPAVAPVPPAAAALPPPSAAVVLFDKARVAAAFKKGEPLIETSAYKVHASHRDAPGRAEVHLDDTDVLYVLSGSATFVTGGSLIDPVTVKPGEIRGTGIKGGERRQLVAGEVIIVPKGTPHWFEAVPGPIDYFAVKVH